LSIELQNNYKNGRNYGLYNDLIREILYFVGISKKPLSIGDIAKEIRNPDGRKMSNEYKIINKLYYDPFKNYRNVVPPPQNYLNYYLIKLRNRVIKHFFLSFRGLLLYLYLENMNLIKESKNDDEKKTDRQRHHIIRINNIVDNSVHNKRIYNRIRRVLSNPLTKNIAPFLQFYEDFEKLGFKPIKILLDTSIELHNQLHIIYDDTYLLNRATERYYIEWENFNPFIIHAVDSLRQETKIDESSISEKINEYRKEMIKFESNDIKIKQQKIKKKIIDCREFGFYKEIDNKVKNRALFIDIKKIQKKYNIAKIQDLNKILLEKYREDYELISNCLISSKEFFPLRKKIYYRKSSDLSSLFKDFPEKYWHILIKALGFKIKNNLIVPK